MVARLGDRLAADLSQNDALAIVAESVASLSFGICRGLYDPVLDDYEPIYEPTDQADSDLRSEPTEVYQDLSLDDPNILDPNITDPSLWDSGYATRPITETRSLTASPFVPNTKPYRPFSTEPLEVPPLDNPIILNPNYKDHLNLNPNGSLEPKQDDLLRLLPLDRNIEAKFKLPVSEKYDPDWDKKVRTLLEKSTEGENRDSQQIEHELACYSDELDTAFIRAGQNMISKKEITVQDNGNEIIFDEKTKMKTQKVEEIALEVVEESIERAVSVTEEIQKEIEEERASMVREIQESKAVSEMKIKELTTKEDRKESVTKSEVTKSFQYKIAEESAEKSEIATVENNTFQDTLRQDQKFVEDKKLSIKKDIEETIETDSVSRKTSVFENQNATNIHKKQILPTEDLTSNSTIKKQSIKIGRKDESTSEEPLNEAHSKKIQPEQHTRQLNSSGKFSNETYESEGKQKAYMIGLQTIPHIKGFVQSSYHFDLLLRTFFVHLTDVMVALSRFILTQPTQGLESTAEKVVKEKLIKEFAGKDIKVERNESECRYVEKKEMVQSVKEDISKENRQENIESKQAANIVRLERQQSHLENFEKQEKRPIEHEDAIKLMQSNAQELVSEKHESVTGIQFEDDIKRKSGAEMAQRTQRKSKELTKKMDAVISEFETKTGIEDRLEVTEQRSRRSRSRSQIEEEVMKESDPLEWLDKVDSKISSQETTNISVAKEFSSYSESKESKQSETKHESKVTKVKPGKQMYVAIVESHVYTNKDAILEEQVAEISETASVQSSEELNTASEFIEALSTENVSLNYNIQSEERQQAVEVIASALQEVVQHKQEVLEAVTDFKTQITEQHSKTATQETHSAVAESTEIISEFQVESFKTKASNESKASVVYEENYKTAAESIKEVILEASKEETIELKVKEQQAVSKLESLAIAVAESTDLAVDDSKVEAFESQKLLSKNAEIKSEETFKTAATSVAEMTFETAEEKHSETAKTCEVYIKEEAQHLAVAGIIETKTEFFKEPKKPAEDEYASLKIVKEEIIDGGETVDISSESVINSLEVDISSSVQSSYQSVQSSVVQETSILQETSSKQTSKLHIDTNLAQNGLLTDQSDENNNTPTPSVPPTPLTDEYIFKLEIPLPKNQGTVIVEDSPDREDPHIVKKGLVPHIETTIEEQIIYDPPLPTPPAGDKLQSPVYTKPGLKGGSEPVFKKEYIREIERKSSLLASAIDETIKSIEEYKEEVGMDNNNVTIQLSSKKTGDSDITNGIVNGHEENSLGKCNEEAKESSECVAEVDAVPGFKPVVFDPETFQQRLYEEVTKGTEPAPVEVKQYVNESGEPLGTVQGIVDGLEDATVDEEVAKELGKPGMTENKIAELISGESEMLREAHVMGLSRVLTSHMTRPDDDSSVDFHKIKPLYESLKNSEVLKALNDEMKREIEEKKKKEEKKLTTFMQKPKRAVPRAKIGYYGYVEPEEDTKEPYTVKIVKQPKPKVAPDYKPEDFDTGPLPWEQRALTEPVPPPVPPEDPILVPEGPAEFLEAVDPLPESEVPDLEDTGISLPPTPPAIPDLPEPSPELPEPEIPEQEPEEVVEEEPKVPEMDQDTMTDQLVSNVRSMVDPNAPLEQQLRQMRAQLAALAQLPCVIQQSLEVLTRQLSAMSRQDSHHEASYESQLEKNQEVQENTMMSIQESQETTLNHQEEQNYQEMQNGHETQQEEEQSVTIEEVQEPIMTAEDAAALQREQDAIIEEQRKSEKDKKEREEKIRLDQESRQVKQRAPRVGKPRPAFGPLSPEERPVVLPGGRRWRCPKDAYNDQFIAETIQAQSEVIQGKAMGYESDRLPYDDRINFMKFEKPPVSLDHLKNSATYKLVHNLEDAPLKRTDLLTPVVAEADYRERCRSATPLIQSNGRM